MSQLGIIDSDIKKLEPFAAELISFFESSKRKALFKKLPLKDEISAAKERLYNGSYLFRPCGVEINVNECNHLALELIELLKNNLKESKAEFSLITDLFMNEKLQANDVLLHTLKNEGNELKKIIRCHNIPEDLFTFFVVYLARPYRQTAAEYLLDGIDKYAWDLGYCPICGHWPVLDHISSDIGSRTLWCLCCNTKWNFKRTQCAFCLNENHHELSILTPEDENNYRIQGCKKCKRYLKEIRSTVEVKNFPFDQMYLGTLLLDVIGENEGFIQESVLTVRYDNSKENELLMYRQKVIT